jgi:hypothetical protein
VPAFLGYLGMTVFFGCLLAYGDAGDAPAWLLLPAAAATFLFIPIGWYIDWRRGRRQR